MPPALPLASHQFPVGVQQRGQLVHVGQDEVETIKVTELTSPSALTKSITNLFSNINKSVNSAFASLLSGSGGGSAVTHPTEDTIRPQPSYQQTERDLQMTLQPYPVPTECPTFRPSFSIGCLDERSSCPRDGLWWNQDQSQGRSRIIWDKISDQIDFCDVFD